MIRRMSLGLTLALCVAALAQADAGFTFYASTVGGPSYNRPNAVGVPSTTSAHYAVVGFYPNEDTDCTIYSTQEGTSYDGHLALYQNSFNPASPLTNLVAVNDDFFYFDGGFGVGTSRIQDIPLTWIDNWILVVSGFNSDDAGTFNVNVMCDSPATRVLPMSGNQATYDGRVQSVLNGRFQIWAEWGDFALNSGYGTFVPMGSNDSGLIWFFQPGNWEVLIKVINACSLNDRYWVFAAATTNVFYRIHVIDTFQNPDVEVIYENPLGNTSPAITDTDAFATCP